MEILLVKNHKVRADIVYTGIYWSSVKTVQLCPWFKIGSPPGSSCLYRNNFFSKIVRPRALIFGLYCWVLTRFKDCSNVPGWNWPWHRCQLFSLNVYTCSTFSQKCLWWQCTKIVKIKLSLVFKLCFCYGKELHCDLLTFFSGERSRALWGLLFIFYACLFHLSCYYYV